MAEQGVCPSEEEMAAEQEIAERDARVMLLKQHVKTQEGQIAMRESVIGDLEMALDRVSQEKADLLAALRALVGHCTKADGPWLKVVKPSLESVTQARAASERAS